MSFGRPVGADSPPRTGEDGGAGPFTCADGNDGVRWRGWGATVVTSVPTAAGTSAIPGRDPIRALEQSLVHRHDGRRGAVGSAQFQQYGTDQAFHPVGRDAERL